MKICNNSSYRYTAIINGKEYNFDRKAVIEFNCTEAADIELKSQHKSTIHLNWIDIILGLFSGDCTVTTLYPDYSFKAFDNDNATIIISDNNWNLREQLSFNACYAKGEIADEKYTISDLQKTRKKHRNLHLFLTSLFPVGLIILILCFFLESQGVLIFIFIMWALIFGIPSIKEIRKFKKNTDSAFINQKLCEFANKRRNDIKYPDVDDSKSGKLISKILNKMFRFDEEK